MIWDFGPLDGRGLAWEKFEFNAYIEALIWASSIILSTVFCYKKSDVIKNISRVLPILGITSVLAAYVTIDPQSNINVQGEYKSTQESFAFHKTNNTLVIVLDTFQSDAFQEVVEKYPEEITFLDGFSFFPDTIAGYPTTKHSIPLILTGSFYKNDFPHSKEARNEFLSDSIIDHYKNARFGTIGIFNFHKEVLDLHGKQISFPPEISDFKYFGFSGQQMRAIDIGLFRASPIVFKKHIYDEGRWFLEKYRKDEAAPPAPHGNDWRFANAFIDYANTNSKNNGEFKFIHLAGAHYPLSLDENYNHIKDIENTREAYINQTRGVLKLTRSLIEKLEELDVYKNSEILIISDHGAHNVSPKDIIDNAATLEVPFDHVGAARPLFLYKKAGATGPLSVDNTPMHLAYAHCLLSKSKRKNCEDYDSALSGSQIIRLHYRYEWAHEFWFKNYSPPMRLYEISGDSREKSSWKNTMIEYDSGKAHSVNKISIGDTIDFGKSGHSGNFIVSGWSNQEEEHRWTEGAEAVLRLRVENPPLAESYLRIAGSGFSPNGKNEPQNVTIEVNGNRIKQWSVLNFESIKIRVPSQSFNDKDLTIKFKIASPTSPCELGLSNDCRKLGFSLTTLGLSGS